MSFLTYFSVLGYVTNLVFVLLSFFFGVVGSCQCSLFDSVGVVSVGVVRSVGISLSCRCCCTIVIVISLFFLGARYDVSDEVILFSFLGYVKIVIV